MVQNGAVRFHVATALLWSLAALWGGVVLSLSLESRHDPPAGRSFQRSVGGFGLGASLTPSWCFFAMDPRVESSCPAELRPIPGGYCASADHNSHLTVFGSTVRPQPLGDAGGGAAQEGPR